MFAQTAGIGQEHPRCCEYMKNPTSVSIVKWHESMNCYLNQVSYWTEFYFTFDHPAMCFNLGNFTSKPLFCHLNHTKAKLRNYLKIIRERCKTRT